MDVYITGSNSKFLSSEINTIFRGRTDEVNLQPFTFKEFCQGRNESENELWKEYYTFGGLPALRKMPSFSMRRDDITSKATGIMRISRNTIP